MEIVVGFVVATLEAVIPATTEALDMAGTVIVNVLVALMVTVLLIVMRDVTVPAMAEVVCAWAVIVSVRVTVDVKVVTDLLECSIDKRMLIASETCAAGKDFVMSQSSPWDRVRTSGYQPYSRPLAARSSRLLRLAQTSVVRYPKA